MSEDDVQQQQPRFKRARPYHVPTAIARGPRLKPGKLAEREAAHLRATGGMQVPLPLRLAVCAHNHTLTVARALFGACPPIQVTRAAVRRLLTQTIKTTVPVIADENKVMARRLEARGKHVPANLSVTPAHQWIITSEAWTKAAACFEVETSLLADVAWMLAEHAGRKSVRSKDFTMANTLIEKLEAT